MEFKHCESCEYKEIGNTYGIMVFIVETKFDDFSSNHEAVGISHSIITLGKGMNPDILPAAMEN